MRLDSDEKTTPSKPKGTTFFVPLLTLGEIKA